MVIADGIYGEQVTDVHLVLYFFLSWIPLGNDFTGDLASKESVVVKQVGCHFATYLGVDGGHVYRFAGKVIENPLSYSLLLVCKCIVNP